MTSATRMPSSRSCRCAVCVALALAAVGDAGPEIVESGSLIADYDGVGPLIYLAFAVFVGLAPWRYAPLAGIALSAMFIFGGISDRVFRDRFVTPAETIDFAGGWLQMVAFAGAIVFGLASLWSTPARHQLTPTAMTGESDSRQDEVQPHDERNDFDR